MSQLKKYFSLAAIVLCSWHVSVAAQDIVESKIGANIIRNSGFEEGSAHWDLKKSAEIVANEAHEGSHSFYYRNDNPEKYRMFTQTLDVQPGDYIDFSVWIKGKNLSSKNNKKGAGIFVQGYEGDTFLGGNYPYAATGTFDWTHVEGAYVVPPNATKVSMGLRLYRTVTGEVWFDDVEVKIKKPNAIQSDFIFPNYRGMVEKGDNSPWRFLLQVRNQNNWKPGDVTVETVLTDSQEKVLLSESAKVSSQDNTTEISVDPPKNLQTGDYLLTQTVTNPNGEKKRLREVPIHIVDKMPKVHIDQEGFTITDGERFFPMGVFGSDFKDEDLQRISKGGFNTILSYTYGAGEKYQEYLERAQKNNLKVVYTLQNIYPKLRGRGLAKGKTPEETYRFVLDLVNNIKDDPSLLAWYTNDEMSVEKISELDNLYKDITQIDADHPTFQVFNKFDGLSKFYDINDVFGADPYPGGQSNDLTKTTVHTDIIATATHRAKGLWIVPQIMDWAVYKKELELHPPSLDEMRNQAYQAIIGGAKGLIWYQYYDLKYEKYPRGKSTFNMDLFDKRWKDVTAMAEEINEITPIVLKNKRIDLSLPKNREIEAAAWQDGNELSLLLANPYYEEKSVTFALPEGWKIKDADQGQIKSTFSADKATFTLPSIGSGVFQLVRK